ncbi:MAG: UDP-N-acetylmuramoyl-L-alanine--D-glutamate ligase [Alphaproteobacteria bacterium]|nr:UDP-N-acetylmuramoyl-L-alanine--D-glutamate ligase [Alphaproteobacteria bacterium]
MLSGSRVTVLGAMRSGRAAAALALRLGAEVCVTDLDPEAAPVEGARCAMGHHPDDMLTEADVVVVSPGVPAAAPPVRRAVKAGVEVVGELGFAHRFLPPELPIVAITGTNGKSTVTSFTGQLLQAAGRRAFVGGNLGTPLSEAVGGDWDVAVVEVSSYQLELPGAFRARAAVILNLTPDHLGRHGDMRGYAAAKARIFDRMGPDDLTTIPVGDALLREAWADKPGRKCWLGQQPGLTLDGERAHLFDQEVSLAGMQVVGRIPRWNAAVACLLATHAGEAAVPARALAPEQLVALPHRMEPVAEQDGVLWINDSKATNVDAAVAGITSLEQPGVVLLGGRGKEGSDYGLLAEALRGRARRVICFGEAGPVIADALGRCDRVDRLEDAVALARAVAQPGDAVLLSPACASFDAFENFEHRGDAFRRLANGEAL